MFLVIRIGLILIITNQSFFIKLNVSSYWCYFSIGESFFWVYFYINFLIILKTYATFTAEKLGLMLLLVYIAMNFYYLNLFLSPASQNPQCEISIPHSLPLAHPKSLISTFFISEIGTFLFVPIGKK